MKAASGPADMTRRLAKAEGEVAPAHLRLEAVTRRFGALAAVDDVTLEIPGGAFATLLGPSGCGKTTLLRLIAGFHEPDSGGIYLDGRRIDGVPAHQRGTGMVFQDYALFPHMRVFDNVAYGLRLAGVRRQELERRVGEMLEFVGLSGLGTRWPNELSGGQQQRVALARALVIQPRVLLLDEPLSNLDAKLRERMRWELRALQRRLGITFVYVTHDQEEALAMSDWVAVLRAGRVEQWGTPWEIYHRPRTAFLADFVGQANLLPTTVLERVGDRPAVLLGGQRLKVAAAEVPIGGDALLCIRPESVTISGFGDPLPDPPWIRLAGTVARRVFLGHRVRYWVSVGDDEWLVDQPTSGVGTELFDGAVVLTIDPAAVHVIPGTGKR
jgi:ABC-type Fe3+/spermidine/putrescine transport system ATPase subunit